MDYRPFASNVPTQRLTAPEWALSVIGIFLISTMNPAFAAQSDLTEPSTFSVAVSDEQPQSANAGSGSQIVIKTDDLKQSVMEKDRSATDFQSKLGRYPVKTAFHATSAPSRRTSEEKVSNASFWAVSNSDPNGSIRPVQYSNNKDVDPQKTQKSKKASPKNKPDPDNDPTAQQVDLASDALIAAHKESLTATTEVQYTLILQLCVRAMKEKTSAENQKYARQMAAWALNRRGQVRSDECQSVLGLADFEAALKYVPTHWRALHNRGVTHAQSGQFVEAFDDFNRVIELNPTFAKAYANRATLYVQAGDMQVALDEYGHALELDDQLLAAHVGRARVCHILGRLEESLVHFDKAVRSDDGNAQYICSRADLLADMGHYRKAMADYAKAIELDAHFAHAYRNGAWLLATCPDSSLRDPDNALLGAERALEYGYGQRHAALDTLAAAQASAGLFDEAVTTVAQAIAIAPAKARQAYQVRMQFYLQGLPFRTTPLDDVQPVAHQE